MSIPVTCDRGFQSFRVKDEFAGRTIRCKDCGAAMAAAWESESASRRGISIPKSRGRKSSDCEIG